MTVLDAEEEETIIRDLNEYNRIAELIHSDRQKAIKEISAKWEISIVFAEQLVNSLFPLKKELGSI